MESKDYEGLSLKLDCIIKLLAANQVRGLKQTEAIHILGQLGLDRNSIASIVGAAPNVVSVRLSEARAIQNKKRAKQ